MHLIQSNTSPPCDPHLRSQAAATDRWRWQGFQSFLQGGFECSTHRLASGRRVDIVGETGHDRAALADFRQLRGYGITTCRDGLRWPLIESSAGNRDFASFQAVAVAARDAGTEVIWDLMHYGWPDGLDIWSEAFVSRFADFAEAAAKEYRKVTDQPPIWCPVNEISFFSWAGGEAGEMNPFDRSRGFALKVQLARAAIAAVHRLRAIDPRARIVLCEPLISVWGDPSDPAACLAAAGMTDAQYQAADMMLGRLCPELGGAEDMVDALGLNYYPVNQWRNDTADRIETIGPDHPGHRPLSDLLAKTHARYRDVPLFIAETGTEGEDRATWFAQVFDQVMVARAQGVPVEGICLYPVASHIGWCGERFCPNGLLGHWPRRGGRAVHALLAAELARARRLLEQVTPAQRRARR